MNRENGYADGRANGASHSSDATVPPLYTLDHIHRILTSSSPHKGRELSKYIAQYSGKEFIDRCMKQTKHYNCEYLNKEAIDIKKNSSSFIIKTKLTIETWSPFHMVKQVKLGQQFFPGKTALL